MARIGVLVAEGFEDAELGVPCERLGRAGHEIVLIGSRLGEEVRGKRGRTTRRIEATAEELAEESFDALVIPGGRSPGRLRGDPHVVGLVRRFWRTGRLVAAICHGPELLVEAGVVKGRLLTSWPSVRGELENAGATWIDREVVEDGNLVTSRRPDDLDAFCRAIEARL